MTVVAAGQVAGLLLIAALSGGCSAKTAIAPPATPSSTTTAAAPLATSRAATDAQILGAGLQYLLLEDRSFADEPKGDIQQEGVQRVFAFISKVTTSPVPTVTFDVAQYYQGSSATNEAARDHKPVPDSGVYTRNAYTHIQTLKLVSSAGVIGQFGVNTDALYGQEDAAQITALTFAEFAARFSKASPAKRAELGYWLEIDDDGIHNITQQYQP
jgi:hypothetical protein